MPPNMPVFPVNIIHRLAIVCIGLVALSTMGSTPVAAPVPSVGQAGIKATPLTTIEVTAPATVKQGHVVWVTIRRLEEGQTINTPLTVTLAGKTVTAYPHQTYWQGVVPINVAQKLGGYTLRIHNQAQATLAQQKIEVISGGYRRQNIKAGQGIAGLQPQPGELAAIGTLKRITTDKHQYWQVPTATPWQSPVPECMNSPFGNLRYHNGRFTGSFHKGVDQRSPHGRTVSAPTNGVVTLVRKFRLHGGTIGLDHGQGVSSIYIHLSKFLVQPGDTVTAGQPIGLVGSSGFATGPHLHWGVYAHGQAVNPRQWVPSIRPC